MPRYIIFNKPYDVLSQFTPEDGARSLAAFGLPKDVYAAGRLDKDSEGLLLLTDDGPLIEKLLNPKNEKPKTYWALVERVPTEEELQRLRDGGIQIDDYKTRPCQVKILDPQPDVPPRDPPVRVRKTVQDVWIEIRIVEGKNRQVRRMTASIGHPTLRLIRMKIANLDLSGLSPGEWMEIPKSEIHF
jgi:23S rRNA pseudouridine2457 synthase